MMNKEKYNQIIDEVYNKYLNEWTFEKHPNDGSVYSVEPIKVKEHTKEQFVYRCKTDNEFYEKWGLKIEERELSYTEREELFHQNRIVILTKGEKIDEEDFDNVEIPTKLITLEYKGIKTESYE